MQNFFQPWHHYRLVWAAVALSIVTSAVAAQQQSALYQLYLVRHAEKQQVSRTESDPVLSECGLAQVCSDNKVCPLTFFITIKFAHTRLSAVISLS